MKVLAMLIILAAGLGFTANDEIIKNKPGEIYEVQPGIFTIVPDNEPSNRYLPDELPLEFRRNGLKVLFSGKVGKVDPNVRMVATPLELHHIEERQ